MEFSQINPFVRYARIQPCMLEWSEPHGAYDHRLFYIIKGQGAFIISDEKYEFSAGTLFCFRAGTFYSFLDNMTMTVTLNFDFGQDRSNLTVFNYPTMESFFEESRILEPDAPAEFFKPLVMHNCQDMEEKLLEIAKLSRGTDEYSKALQSALLKEVLCKVVRKKYSPQQKNMKIISNVLAYIQKNLSSELKNTEIAAAFGYHPVHLNRVFKAETGKSLHQTVIYQRIHIAKKLLKYTPLSIDGVVKQVGFYDRPQFCTAFKKHTGMTPLEYRKAVTDEKNAK